jgi:hypothetical protein
MRLFILFLFGVFLISCNSKVENKKIIEKNAEYADDEIDTTALTPEEEISNALVLDILDSYEDDDLQSFIEENLFSELKNSEKVTIDKLSASLYVLSYDKEGTQKNILIQKFYNSKSGEIFFEKSDLEYDIKSYFLKK